MRTAEEMLEERERWAELLRARPLQLEWWGAVRLAALLRLEAAVRLEDPERADALLSALLDHLRPPYDWDSPEDYEQFEQDVSFELHRLRG